MAFKDVRDLSEHLKLLGYPNAFPLSALYSGHGGPAAFKIVADILQWMSSRLEPGTVLPGGVHHEHERVQLIRSAAEFFVTKTGVKINPRKLYASSMLAAKELLKITSILMGAPQESHDDDDQYNSLANIQDLGDKIDELRRARELSSTLTTKGAALYDLLEKEMVNKESRTLQASRPMELNSVEKSIKLAISNLQKSLQTGVAQRETHKAERSSLSAKLQRKTGDLERSRQRLQSLQKIRPAFLDEFERLEEELKELFGEYFIRIRCIDSLKHQVASRVRTPARVETPIPKPSDTSIGFITDGLIDSDDEDVDDEGDIKGDDDDEDDNLGLNEKFGGYENKDDAVPVRRAAATRLRVRTGVQRGGADRRVIGSMGGSQDLDDMTSTLGSGDTDDSEINLDDDLQFDEDEAIGKIVGGGPAANRTLKIDHSDEDF